MERFRPNPESMRPTRASEHPRVEEANQIVGREAFKVMWEEKHASQQGKANAVVHEAAQDFLNGPDYNIRKQRRGQRP